MADRDTRVIDNTRGDDALPTPFRYSITAYGADYPVDALVKRLEDGSIYKPPFQRNYVWNFPQACKFIESLLLGLPVPGIFLSRVQDTQKLLIVDGQQRLLTLKQFYSGIFEPTGKQFILTAVQDEFIGKTYSSLSEEDRRRLDDTILHATVVRQDEPSDDQSSIYYLFERLNTGGTPLVAQEIRACIYEGELNTLLGTLNENASWRAVYGNPSPRMRDQELILRFLAFYFAADKYERPMKEFLNNFMIANRDLKKVSTSQMTHAFNPTIDYIVKVLGYKAFKPNNVLNAATFEAVMVATAKRLSKSFIGSDNEFKACYEILVDDPYFTVATRTGTSDPESVKTRHELAEDLIFAIS